MTQVYVPDLATGCDKWTGARYCDADPRFEDEITGQRFCQLHAGPLAWDDHTISMYSMAVRIAGELGIPVRWRSENEEFVSGEERAA
jgi:hypothetical protein